MAWVVKDKLGWQLSGDSGQALFTAYNSTDIDPANARAAVEAFAPTTLGTLPRGTVEVTEKGKGWWEASAKYGKSGGSSSTTPATDTSLVRFNTRIGSFHVTLATAHVTQYAAPSQVAPDFKGAIGVDQEGNVAGCDWPPAGGFEFEVVRYVSAAKMTSTYLGILYAMTAKINTGTFNVDVNGESMSFAAQEAVFLGATGAMRKKGTVVDWEVSYYFSASKNETGLTVGPITGIAKKGMDHMWIRYVRSKDAGCRLMVPASAHIERIGKLGDFSTLEPV